ncbi:PAS domain-containing sensor histidine kinase [Fundidesulfovibrio soli]|uniref:sensor histidine kinase n=1 Tax=Fundidesulfovibrio soli TaxID=2922716 RepID=UPI001FB01047|nr:PAS domain-containing sensor histidine kinase [Fundidesulfovibrio soli]
MTINPARPYLVPILFLVFLGMLLTTAISYFHTKQTAEDMAVGQMTQALDSLNRDVSGKVQSLRGNLALWSQEDVFRLALSDTYLGRSARQAAEKRLAGRLVHAYYDRAILARPDGLVVASSDPAGMASVKVLERDYFKRSLKNEVVTSTVLKSYYTGKPVMVVSSPVQGQDKQAAGVLALVVDIGRISHEILDSIRIGKSGGAYLLDDANQLLGVPSWSRSGQFHPGEEAARKLRAANGTAVVRYQNAQTERMAVATINPDTDWVLVVEADADELLRPASRLAAVNALVSLCVLALVAVALYALRNAIARLRFSEGRYRALTETTPVGIATFDAAGRPDYLNERAQQIFELAPTEENSRPKNWTELFEDKEGASLSLSELPPGQALATQRPVLGMNVWFRLGSGNRKALMFNAAPLLGENGQVTGVVAAFEDITERSRIQEIMVQTEKMMSVGGLAAGMAHEINNPLASILQALQVITRRMDPAQPANIRVAQEAGLDLEALRAYMRLRGLDQFLEGIREGGVRASRIVSNMLGFARKSGRDYAVCDPGDLLEKALELAGGDYDLKKHYDFRHVRIVRDFSTYMPKVECQPMEIEQVFFNIIKNAAQAMKSKDYSPPRTAPAREGRKGLPAPEGAPQELENDALPAVSLASPLLTLRTQPEKNAALVIIEDNGPGMSEEVRRRIFEPFYTTKSIGEGTGLGLSVAYFIVVENHKGSIDVETTPGQGTRFLIRLPYRRGL